MPQPAPPVIGGVDTHKDVHVAAALSAQGALLGTASFPTTPAGYADLLGWLQTFGPVGPVGIEGTGSWGAGLCRSLRGQGLTVLEVARPNRQWRRRRGKSDPTDAEAAARAVLARQALGVPTDHAGPTEALRLVRLARRSALRARTQAANQLHAVVDTAPDELRERLRRLTVPALVKAARAWRPGPPVGPRSAARFALKLLAERWQALDAEVQPLDQHLLRLVREAAPRLLAARGVGPETASALLVAVGEQPQRLRSEAAFAALCGVSPVDASSGRQRRHRLNRGGNRDANRALWVITLARLRHDAQSQAYLQRRTAQGLSKREAIRCLKRYLARELFRLLRPPALPPLGYAPLDTQ